MGEPFPEHLFKAMTAKSMAEAVKVWPSVFTSAMGDATLEQDLPKVGRHGTYGIAIVPPPAHEKVVITMVSGVYL